jgi:O-antigen/teichoic acid export membrane protein
MISDLQKARPTERYRSILGLIAGSGAAQLGAILSYPVLARLYSPADYGIYGGVMGVVAILVAAMRMRADKLVLFTGIDSARRDLLLTFLILNAVVAGIGLATTPLFLTLLPSASGELLLIGVGIAVATSIIHMLTSIHASALKTRQIVNSQFIRTVAVTAAQALLFFLALGPLGLMIGTAVGLLVPIVFLVRTVRSEALLPAFSKLTSEVVLNALRQYVPKLFWGSLQGFAGSITNSAPIIFAAAVFSPAMAGLYVMADRIIRVPIALLVTTSRSYVAVHSRTAAGLPDIRFMLSISLVMSLVATAIVLPLLLLGEPLLAFLLGDRWAGTGSVAAILSIFMLFSFFALPYQAYVQSLGRSRELIFIELTYLAARILPMLLWKDSIDLRGLAVIVVFSNLVYNGLYSIYFLIAYRKGTLATPLGPTELNPIENSIVAKER